MDYQARQAIYRRIERERQSKVLLYATSDRQNLETQIAPDIIDLFVELLDKIGPTAKISLVLHTNGGNTSAAWRLINLIRTFCDHLEVLIPTKAMSAGTLISLGADKILMTKQAVLGPIDPSLTHPLNPTVVGQNGMPRFVPVSVEAVRGYLDQTEQLKITDANALANILVNLSQQIHPLVLGEIFRSREQIRFLADKLIRRQVTDEEKIKKIIDFLCADSGSHDYTINRREGHELGLAIEKPSPAFYKVLRSLHRSYSDEMKLLEPYSQVVTLGTQAQVQYSHVRSLIESTQGGSYRYVTEGTLVKTQIAGPMGMQDAISENRTFDGWKKL